MIVKTIEQARQQVWRIDHWRGEYFSLMYLIATVAPGIHETIDGKLVNVPAGQGSCAWSGCSLFPRFATEAEAAECAKQNGLQLVQA